MVRAYHATLDLVSEAALANFSELVEQSQAYAEAIREVAPEGDILDLGSGVGLPGVVVASTFPARRVWLVERRRRRATFLKMVVAGLDLEQAVVIEADVAEIRRDELGVAEGGDDGEVGAGRAAALGTGGTSDVRGFGGVDVITAQAVASFVDVYCLTRHLHGPAVKLFSRKGPSWPDEVNALEDATGAAPAVLGEPVSMGGGTLVGIGVRGGLPCLRSA